MRRAIHQAVDRTRLLLLAVALFQGAVPMHNVVSAAGGFTYQFNPGLQDLPSAVLLPPGASIANSYDGLARLTNTALNNSQASSLNSHQYGYDPAFQRTNQTRLKGDYVTYTYDGAGQLKTAQAKEKGGGTNRWQEQFGYAYDAAGNLAARTNNGLVETFTANDSLNELSSAVSSGTLTVAGGTVPSATGVTVSGSANGTAILYADRTWAMTNATLPNGTATYTATASDGLGHQATASVSVNYPASVAYLYDKNGNLTNDGSRSFTYDDENQLTGVSVANVWNTYFAYDGRMRLRKRTECAWTGSSWTTNATVLYLYDGSVVVQEQDPTGTPKVSYTRGRDLSGTTQGAGGIGGLLARTDNALGTQSYYHADGNGNITCLIDTNQAVAATYLYDPFGRILSQSGPMANANVYRFSSKEFHANSGLSLYPFRGYDPNLQRFLSRDPIGEFGGINLYGFVGNNPMGSVDPYGLTWAIFDPQAWMQLFKNAFIGDTKQSALDPNSLQALKNNAGLGASPLYDENGNLQSPGDAVLQIVGQVPNGILQAGMMMGGLGEGGGAYEAADKALKAAQAAKALSAARCLKVAANAADKAKLMTSQPDVDYFVGIIDQAGNIRLFQSGENGIFGHPDLVRQGLATQGETLGFSVGLDAQGIPIPANISELNVHLGLNGALPSQLFNAVRAALGAK